MLPICGGPFQIRHAEWNNYPQPHRRYGVGNTGMNRIYAFTLLIGTLLVVGGCAGHNAPATTKWEYQDVQNGADANEMTQKGWIVAGVTRFTDATGRPQVTYSMKRPKH
jgi:hypothetical protein